MSDQLPIHWGFAFGSAFEALRKLVHAFDFQREAGGAAYVGLTPTFLVDVIDGFLTEDSSVVLPGNRTELVQFRKILIDEIVPSFERGKVAGRSHWLESGQGYGALTIETVHASAQRAALSESFAPSWFVEGFSVAYTAEEMESVQKSTNDSNAA